VECVLTSKNTSARPDATDSSREAFRPVGSHGSLDDLQRLSSVVSVFPERWLFCVRIPVPELSLCCVQSASIPILMRKWAVVYLLKHVETSTNCTQSACIGNLSQYANSRNRLLNLTGFFSSETPVAGVELILWDCLVEDMRPDQGKGVLRRKCE
jgi:hypothetical protein